MPDMLSSGQPSKANNYSRELYQAELAWDKITRINAIKKTIFFGVLSIYQDLPTG